MFAYVFWRPWLATGLAASLLAAPAPAPAPADDPVCFARRDCKKKVLWRNAVGQQLIQASFTGKKPVEWCEMYEGRRLIDPPGHLVWRDGARAVRVAEFCNDGHGWAEVGENSVEVQGNTLTLGYAGGGSMRWSTTVQLALPQLRFLGKSYGSFSPPEINNQDQWDLDYRNMHYRAVQSVELLTGNASPGDEGNEFLEREYIAIPRIESPEGYDWRRHELGDCAILIDGSDSESEQARPAKKRGQGFQIHGHGKGASFKVLQLGADRLVVEIDDPRWMAKASKPLYADHLELWLSPEETGYENKAERQKSDQALLQWSISPFDGSTAVLRGKPAAPLRAEAVAGPQGKRRVHITLPKFTRLTLVYSDSDLGRNQDRLLATSRFEFGRAYTLGDTKEFDLKNSDRRIVPGGNACVLAEDKRLVYRFREGLPFEAWFADKDSYLEH